MKRQFVETLQEGDVVNDYFVATRKDLREQQKGGKFLGMVFKDRSGEIGGILWNNASSVAKLFEVGDVVNVRGTIVSYQDRLQVRVDQVLPMRKEEYSAADLIYEPGRHRPNRGQVPRHPRYHSERFSQTPRRFDPRRRRSHETVHGGGRRKKWHHAYRGGLVQHCDQMARLALTMGELFPNLDKDVLLTGILVHDIGKLDEMSQDLFVDYTTVGKLLGHLSIGSDLVQRRIDAIPDFPETLRIQVLHCVLSHHGTLENGSPVLPKTLEALVLYHLDNLDAQADAFTRIVQETREKSQAWSEFIPLIDRQVWTKEM